MNKASLFQLIHRVHVPTFVYIRLSPAIVTYDGVQARTSNNHPVALKTHVCRITMLARYISTEIAVILIAIGKKFC